MRKLSWKACLRCMKNHLTSLGRSLGLSIHFTKRLIKFYEHHLDCIFCFSFWNGQGVAHGWVSELICLYHKSCYYLLVLELHTQTRPKISWIVKKTGVSQPRTLAELESQPQNMNNFNEVAKDACLPPDFVREPSLFSVRRSFNLIINLKSKSLLPWVVGRRSLQVMQQIGRQTPPWGKSLS